MNDYHDPLLQAALARLLGPAGRSEGQPLDRDVRERLERLLGRSLADLRVHTSDLGAAIARRLGADALTVAGQVIGSGAKLNPADPTGFTLVAHEAVHAVQQLSPPDVLGMRGGEAAEPAYSTFGPFDGGRATPPLALAPTGRSGFDGVDAGEAQARRVEALTGGTARAVRPPAPPEPAVVADQVYRMMADELRFLRERSGFR